MAGDTEAVTRGEGGCCCHLVVRLGVLINIPGSSGQAPTVRNVHHAEAEKHWLRGTSRVAQGVTCFEKWEGVLLNRLGHFSVSAGDGTWLLPNTER